MKKFFLHTLLLFVAILLISCSKENGSYSVLNLEGEFIINVNQSLTEEGPWVSLDISTVHTQECGSSEIIYEIRQEESGVNLVLEDISVEDDCATEEGIVTQKIALPNQQKDIDIAISLRDVIKNKGTIQVDDDKFTLNLNTTNGIILARYIVNRIPEDLVFGTINIEDATTIDQVTVGLDSLSDQSLDIGHYGIFTNTANGFNILDHDVVGNNHEVYFRPTDIEAFRTKLDAIKADNPSINIYLVNAYGEIL